MRSVQGILVWTLAAWLAGCVGGEAEDVGGALLTLVDPVELTSSGDLTDPAWSPDGATVSFSGPGYRGLYAVPAQGGAETEIAPAAVLSAFRHRWLDAERILCPARGRHAAIEISLRDMSARTVIAIDAVEPLYLHDEQIWVRGEVEDTRLGGDGDRYFELLTAPGGEHVAVVGLATGIHVIEAATGITRAVLTGTHPAWTPDGLTLLFERTVDDGHRITGSELWAHDVASGQSVDLTGTPSAIELQPSVSPDGRSVAYVRDGAIWVAGLEEVIR